MDVTTQQLVIQMRMSSGMSLRHLASEIGTSPAALVDYEKGRHEPRISTLRRLAEATNMDLVIEVRPKMVTADSAPGDLTRKSTRGAASG